MKSYYEFKGKWPRIFDTLSRVITPANVKKISVWESKINYKENLLIVYEFKLANDCEQVAGMNRIPESEFLMKYKSKMDDHKIHGFNEFRKSESGFFHVILKKLATLFRDDVCKEK